MRLVKIPYNNAVGNNEEPVGAQGNRQIQGRGVTVAQKSPKLLVRVQILAFLPRG